VDLEIEPARRADAVRAVHGGTSEANLRLYRSVGYVDIGWRPAPAAPGLAYLEKRA
jgi:hypothetical protein